MKALEIRFEDRVVWQKSRQFVLAAFSHAILGSDS
jgi:hypothetical protein